MDKLWDARTAFGEFIGSLMLTLAILFTVTISKKKAFGLDTPLKRRGFTAVSLMLAVTISILAAHEFGGIGFINPAIACILAMIEMHFTSLLYIIGFELIGAVGAVVIFALTIWTFNRQHEDKVVLKETFKFNQQSPSIVFGYEWLANIFWLLPIAGLLCFTGKGLGHVGTSSVFELAFAAAMGLGIIILVTNEWAAANLNPQVWFAEFIIKSFAQRSIKPKELFSELLSVTTVIGVGLTCGAIAYGANML